MATKRKVSKKKKKPARRFPAQSATKLKKKPAAAKKKKARSSGGAAKPVGKIIHFYNHISVAIIKFNTKIKIGARLEFKGATTDFSDMLKSMQYDHKPIVIAPKGKEIGVKVKKRVREGDLVYLVK